MAEETWRESAVKSMKRDDTIYDNLSNNRRMLMRITNEIEKNKLELEKLEDQISQEKVGTDYYQELLNEIRKINGRILDLNDGYKIAMGRIQDIENKIRSNNKKITNKYNNEETDR